jgi:hypothetical protein
MDRKSRSKQGQLTMILKFVVEFEYSEMGITCHIEAKLVLQGQEIFFEC